MPSLCMLCAYTKGNFLDILKFTQNAPIALLPFFIPLNTMTHNTSIST